VIVYLMMMIIIIMCAHVCVSFQTSEMGCSTYRYPKSVVRSAQLVPHLHLPEP
jgi:hypothetical protein